MKGGLHPCFTEPACSKELRRAALLASPFGCVAPVLVFCCPAAPNPTLPATPPHLPVSARRNKFTNCTFEQNRGHALYVYAGRRI